MRCGDVGDQNAAALRLLRRSVHLVVSVADLAKAIKVSRQTVNELINEQRALSAAMAPRLSRYFGNSQEFWLNAQRELDLWEAARAHKEDLKRIKPASAA